MIYLCLGVYIRVHWRGDRVVEGARLESGCTWKQVPRVRIPLSPLKHQLNL